MSVPLDGRIGDLEPFRLDIKANVWVPIMHHVRKGSEALLAVQYEIWIAAVRALGSFALNTARVGEFLNSPEQ